MSWNRRERNREAVRRYREANPEKIREKNRRYREANVTGMRICRIEGCEKLAPAPRTLCGMHRSRIRNHGDPNFVTPPNAPRTETPSYFTLHARVKKARGSASGYLCEGCCGGRAREWATLHGRDGLDVYRDYVPLCNKCHQEYDGHPAQRARWGVSV